MIASSKGAAPLPPLGRPPMAGARRNSLAHRRRLSLSMLPGPHECTVLPGLASVHTLLQEEQPTLQDYESQIQKMTSQLETTETTGSVSPRKNQLTSLSGHGMVWHVIVLGRTFKEHSDDHVTDSVSEVLELDREEAAARVAKAKDKLMDVLCNCADRSLAFQLMYALRARGLVVDVTSEASTAVRSEKSSKAARRHSFSSVPNYSSGMESTVADVFGVRSPSGSPMSRRSSAQSPSQSPGLSAGSSPRQRRLCSKQRNLDSCASQSSGGSSPHRRHPQAGLSPLLNQAFEFEVQQLPADAVEALFEKEKREEERVQTEATSAVQSAEEDEEEKEQTSMIAERKSNEQTMDVPLPSSERTSKTPRLKALIRKHRSEIQNKAKQEGPTPPATADTGSSKKGVMFHWDNVLDMLEMNPGDAISPSRKEACDMMRFLIFGFNWVLGMTQEGVQLTSSQIDAVYQETIGTKEEVRQVLSTFHLLDCDRSGRVDQAEMQSACDKLMKQRFAELGRHVFATTHAHLQAVAFPTSRLSLSNATGDRPALRTASPPREPRAESKQQAGRRHSVSANSRTSPELSAGEAVSPKQRRFTQVAPADYFKTAVSGGISLPAWAQHLQSEDSSKAAVRALDKLTQYVLGKKSSFTLEDMLRTIWMKAKRSDVDKMKSWCKQFIDEARHARVATPPVLQQGELDGLKSVFKHYDTEGAGELSFDQLVTLGLIYEDQMDKCREEWDTDGNGVLDMQEFCQMMCPAGYRATRDSQIGTLKDGKRVRYDIMANLWRLEDAANPASESIFRPGSASAGRQ